ncbi:hypothetical protein OROMI_029412 [Orobanche minor]
MSIQPTQSKNPIFLDELNVNVSGPIVAMICRKWDVNAVTGRYLSTDFLISDGRGNIMHCTAKSNTAHKFVDKLKEGIIYYINDFTVLSNKEDYRIMKDSAYMIEFDGATSMRRSSVKPDGFVRHPFDLIDFDNLQPTNNKFLIDVVGYVTNVGRSIQQRTGSRTLDFFLANQRGQAVRVTLWGGLGDVLIEKKTKNVGLYAIILTSVNAKHYNNKLYFSSSSSTLILDDAEIPALKEFNANVNVLEVNKEALLANQSEAKAGTLENLLMWARNRKNDSATFICEVKINNIRTRKGWNYPSCGHDKCKKGLTRKEGKFWCEACNKPVAYPVVRYRLEIDVSDSSAHTVVVMFDETATELVKCSAESLLEGEDEVAEDQPTLPHALSNIIGTSQMLELKSHTYYEHGQYESFTCWNICAAEPLNENTCSGSVTASTDAGRRILKRLSSAPSVSTPSKPSEDKRKKSIVIEESDTEITCAEDKEPKYAEDAEPTDQKQKKKSTRTLTNQLRSQILEAVAQLNGIIVSVFNE